MAQNATSTRTATTPGTLGGCCDVYFADDEKMSRVRDEMLSADHADELAQLFKVMAHPTRIRILRALDAEELCVCDIAHLLGMTVSAVSHQLRTMRAMRIVRTRSEGKLVYYKLKDEFTGAMIRHGTDHIRRDNSE